MLLSGKDDSHESVRVISDYTATESGRVLHLSGKESLHESVRVISEYTATESGRKAMPRLNTIMGILLRIRGG